MESELINGILIWICAFLVFILGVSIFFKFDVLGYLIGLTNESLVMKVFGIILIILSILIFIFTSPFFEGLGFKLFVKRRERKNAN